VRSRAIGLEGKIHVYDLDGQAYYVPGATHKEYLEHMEYEEDDDEEEITEDRMVEALRAVVAEIMNKSDKTQDDFKIIKVDEEHRILYGWASVTTYKGELVVDRQGDAIETDTMHKAVNEFMKGVRVGKFNHDGEPIGQIVHSFPVTKEICAALEIQSDKEGWITGFYVEQDELWEAVKSGEYAELSIGGAAMREEL
jgi:hypothetical protein